MTQNKAASNNSVLKLIIILTLAPLLFAVLSLTGFTTEQTHWLNDLIQSLHNLGIFGITIFILIYAIATSLVLPATALNLAAGAIYGTTEGLLLATLGAWCSAILSFAVARWIAPNAVHQWLNRYPETRATIEMELVNGGLGYSIACRLLPIVPYGIVSVVAALSAFSRRDYIWGTLIGTPIGLIPFVWLGAAGQTTLQSKLNDHDALLTPQTWLEMVLAMMAVALLVGLGTWYSHHRRTKIQSDNSG